MHKIGFFVAMANRCVRNNNPLNIKRGGKWLGLQPAQSDPVFCQFQSIAWGFRAAWYLIRKYINVYHVNTPQSIISRWCPDSTAPAYINYVCDKAGLDQDQKLTYSEDQDKIAEMILAMARYEGYDQKLDGDLMVYIQKGKDLL